MMQCKYTPKDIGLYMTNRMTPEEMMDFQLHLDECDKCKKQLSHLRALAKGLADERTNLKRSTGKKYFQLTFFKMAVVASVMILIGIGIGTFLIPGNDVVLEEQIPDIFNHGEEKINATDSTKNDTLYHSTTKIKE